MVLVKCEMCDDLTDNIVEDVIRGNLFICKQCAEIMELIRISECKMGINFQFNEKMRLKLFNDFRFKHNVKRVK